MIGKKVKLKEKCAKWYLDNADIFFVPGTNKHDKSYDAEMQLFLMCLIGVPVYGIIDRQGANNYTWFVDFCVDGLHSDHYYEEDDFEVVK
jgi:hypothetical protein